MKAFRKMQKHMHGGVDVHLNEKISSKKGKDLSLKGFGFTLHVEEGVLKSQNSRITDYDLLRFASVCWVVTEVLLDFYKTSILCL